MTNKQALVKELDEIVELTTKQNYHYVRGRAYLYEGFATVYLWWLKAKQIEGFLEEQYQLHKIGGKEHEQEKFTRVLRLTWRLDWADESKAKLQQWSNALRKIDEEFKTNKDAYKTDAKKKIVLFIEDKGGLRKLIGADKYDFDDDGNQKGNNKKKGNGKSVRSDEDEAVIAARHLQLGEEFFDSTKAISSIQSTKPITVNRKGYALALIREKAGGKFDVLATLDNETQIQQAIVASYRRNNSVAPTVLRLLTEVIQTQSLPVAMEKHRYTLQDTIKLTAEDGSVLKYSQNKRVLFRSKQQDILLSENRTGCSVVTIAKPKAKALASSSDVFLNVNDRRYLEQAIIQRNELSFYTTNDKDKVPVLRDTERVASHRLVVENKVLGKKRAIYFYKLSTVGEHSRIQANVNDSVAEPVLFKATVNKLWLEKVNALFVSSWLREYGERITWAKHNLLSLGFDSKGLAITHYGERGNFSNKSLPIEFPAVGAGKAASVMVLSKDMLPLLSGLVDVDIVGKVTISVTESCIAIAYATELADYQVTVPTCSVSGKRSKTAFAAYGD
jgi:hypothetical protein